VCARTLAARVAARVATVGDSVVPVDSEATVVVWVEGARSEAMAGSVEVAGDLVPRQGPLGGT